MSEHPEIELPRSDFRELPRGPLGNPKQLRIAFAGFLTGAVLCAIAAVALPNVWWLPFTPIGPAVWAGASLAGLWPRWFFGTGESDDT